MAYASYEFYKTTFGGSAIPQEKWQPLAVRADGVLNGYTYHRLILEQNVPECAMLAACAIADVIFSFSSETARRNMEVKSESNDGLSVAYESVTDTLARKKSEYDVAVNTYIPLSHPLRYRGV